MRDLPASVDAYLQTHILAARSPAYLLVRHDGCLEAWGGELARYGITALRGGIAVEAQVDCLVGLFSTEPVPLCLPCVETTPGIFADLHLFPAPEGMWVLLLDATPEATQRRMLQQKANDMVLLQESCAAIFGQRLGQEMVQHPSRVMRGVMMTASLLAQMFAALDTVILECTADGTFRLLSAVPAWFTRLYPAAATQQEGLQPGQVFPFLENFLIDAEHFWRTRGTGQLKSGPWRESDAAGQEYDLEASALCVGQHQILCIAFPHLEFAEKQSIVQRAREERLAHIQLQKEIEKKDILLHCIVHDLAGPLTSIVGSLAFLEEENLTSDGREFLAISMRQAARQQRLIQQILDVFATEMGAIESFARDAAHAPDAAQCAQEVVRALAPAGAAQEVALQMDPAVDRTADWKVVGEQSRLERVIFNLVENALRHSPAGAVVTVGVSRVESDVLVTVDDEGPGIPSEVRGTLFEKFAQGPGQRGKAGLGLYFCRMTVEHWGGSIGCTPRAAGGTRFWFRLPRPTP
ncbi:MAG: HAMP domain-containing histidine kinase [candidate division KSB1 bacterium]|nr:HAMP domain-containing histidine kinase [candidate division KSB1 bacterium]